MRINVTRDAKKSPTADEDKNGNRHVSAASNHGPIDAKVFEKWVEVETDRMNAMAAAPGGENGPKRRGRSLAVKWHKSGSTRDLGALAAAEQSPQEQDNSRPSNGKKLNRGGSMERFFPVNVVL